MNDDGDIIPSQLIRLARVRDQIGLRAATSIASHVLEPTRITRRTVLQAKRAVNSYLKGEPDAHLQRAISVLAVLCLVQPVLPTNQEERAVTLSRASHL